MNKIELPYFEAVDLSSGKECHEVTIKYQNQFIVIGLFPNLGEMGLAKIPNPNELIHILENFEKIEEFAKKKIYTNYFEEGPTKYYINRFIENPDWLEERLKILNKSKYLAHELLNLLYIRGVCIFLKKTKSTIMIDYTLNKDDRFISVDFEFKGKDFIYGISIAS